MLFPSRMRVTETTKLWKHRPSPEQESVQCLQRGQLLSQGAYPVQPTCAHSGFCAGQAEHITHIEAGLVKLISQRLKGRLAALWRTGPRGQAWGEPALRRPGLHRGCEEPTSLRAGLGFPRMETKELSRLWAPEGGSAAINSEPREGGS